MSAKPATQTPRPSAAARAEAAAWVARLHGPNRTKEVEVGFRRWLSEDPERAAAFELLTETWERSAQLRRGSLDEVTSWQRPGLRISFSRAALATLAVASLAVLGTLVYMRSDAVSTGIGEQRTLVLEDGTRVILNTDTRATVDYDKQLRRVRLEKGEALFEVAKRDDWPFIVTAGDRQVRALGTAFVVRRYDEQNVAVTLVEGKVTISPVVAKDSNPTALAPASRSKSHAVFTLSPGQRLTLIAGKVAQLDEPPLDRVTAWRRGQVVLDNTRLADAVAEMNRYSRVRIVLDDPSAAAIPISGLFRAGDSENFARAVAKSYGMQLREASDEIVLVGKPL